MIIFGPIGKRKDMISEVIMGDFEDCCCDNDFDDDFDIEEDYAEIFEDPCSRSALRKVTINNPRNQPCPTCGEPDMLTPADVRLHYCCDSCANRTERGCY